MEDTAALIDALNQAGKYPRNGARAQVHEHTLRAIEFQLHKRSRNLFGPKAEVCCIDWDSHEHGYIETILANSTSLGNHLLRSARQRRKDPIQRFIFIRAPHSRAPLKIHRDMLLQVLTYHQVVPTFLEFVFPFGNQHYTRDFYLSGFRSETCVNSVIPNLAIPSLGRSGRHVEFCYNLKSIEPTSDAQQPWAIRQCSVHHRFDVTSKQSTWIIVKANKVIQDAISAHNRSTSETMPQCQLLSSLDIHRTIADWAGENWHWYINDLEEMLQQRTRRLLTVHLDTEAGRIDSLGTLELSHSIARPKSNRPFNWQLLGRSFRRATSFGSSTGHDRPLDTGHSFHLGPVCEEPPSMIIEDSSFSDLQRLQKLEDKANEVLLLLKTNGKVIAEISDEYTMLLSPEAPVFDTLHNCKEHILSFARRLSSVVKDMSMQESRIEALLRVCGDRKSLLQGILQYQSMQASRELAHKTHLSSVNVERMTTQMREIAEKTLVETVSMRIITVVTLLFLPGTFISTLMSTPIIRGFDGGPSGFSSSNIGTGALKLYLLVSLPLMGITLFAWAYMIFQERRRSRAKGSDMYGRAEDGMENDYPGP